jgi:2-haloacid dehalogenase
MDADRKPQTWPDLIPALRPLKKPGYRLAFLNNLKTQGWTGGSTICSAAIVQKRSNATRGLTNWEVKEMKLKRGEILFVAHAGWAASSAKVLGCPAYWVGRQNLPPEEFLAFPDGSGDTLSQLVQFLT